MNEIVKVEHGVPVMLPEVVERIVELERDAKAIERQQKDMKAAILEAMEENGVEKYQCEKLSIAYVPTGIRETFDTASFREDFPELYKKYTKVSGVKPSVKITVRG